MTNVFANIIGAFKGKDGSFLGVDLGSSSIKVVQVANKGGQAVLETYGEVALGPYAGIEAGRAVNLPVDKMFEAFNDVLREAKISAPDSAVSIPLLSSLVAIFEIPSFSGVELDQMVGIELKKYIPVPMNEVAVDWQILPASGANLHLSSENADEGASFKDSPLSDKKEVIAVAIHNDALNYIKDVVTRAGKNLKFFELESFSIARSSVGNHEPMLIADVGAGSTKMSIVEEGTIRVSHIVNFGSQDVTLAISGALNISVAEAEKIKIEKGLDQTSGQNPSGQNGAVLPSLRYVVYEMKKLISDYENRRKKAVKHIVLSGGGSALKGFAELVGTDTQIETKVADPFAKLQVPSFMRNDMKNIGPSFSVAVGLALRGLSEHT